MADVNNALLAAAAKIRKQLDALNRDRRAERLQFAKDVEAKGQKPGLLKTITLAADTAFLAQSLSHRLAHDMARYGAAPLPTPPQPVQLSPPVQELVQELSPILHTAHAPVPENQEDPAATLIPRYMVLLEEELAHFTTPQENQATQASQAAMLNKLRQVQQAVAAGRLTDGRTLLRNLQRADPHNPTVSYLLSQLEYLNTGLGHGGSLPEARDQAQRSITPSERTTPAQLFRYRYEAIVTELPHSPDRALEWLRDSSFLNPELLQQEEGLTALKGLLLMGWVILGRIPASLWQDTETTALATLVEQVTGGAFLYAAFLRAPLLAELPQRKHPLAHVQGIEAALQTASLLHAHAAQGAAQVQGELKEPPWLVKIRYAQAVLSALPPPTFDQVLLNVALSGQQWLRSTPTQALHQALEDRAVAYWRIWALSITPQRDRRQPHLLPFDEIHAELPIATEVEALLRELSEHEQSLLKPELWEQLQPYMPRWTLDHLLAAGTGSNKPRSAFSPTLAPYAGLYNSWALPSAQGVLASHIIWATAQKGGFASWFEVLAAIEGATRLATDPIHGLKPTQKQALSQAKKQNPQQFAGYSIDTEGLGTTVQLALVGGGMLLGTWAAWSMSDNLGQSLGLMLAVLGLGGILLIRLLSNSA